MYVSIDEVIFVDFSKPIPVPTASWRISNCEREGLAAPKIKNSIITYFNYTPRRDSLQVFAGTDRNA